MKLPDIHLRDPFVLPLADTGTYYLFGSTDENVWTGPGTGFDCYRSRDLEAWDGPIPAFRPEPGFWGTTQFWAPEVHPLNSRFFLFATFNAEGAYRGTQILVSDRPEGPYEPWTNGPVTPPHWQCLDGTLHIDEAGNPWMIFCHEWVQIHNGAMYALPLSPDLKQAAGRPVFLFSATEAPWVRGLSLAHTQGMAGAGQRQYQFPVYVTDGPFLHRTGSGALLMLWSSFGTHGYAMGIARSRSGKVGGPWRQDPDPIWAEDGGHGMIFRAFDGRLFLAIHAPNDTPNERAIFRELIEDGDHLKLRGIGGETSG